MGSLDKYKEEISEIKYLNKDTYYMIFIATTKNSAQRIYAYKGTNFYGSDISADVDAMYYSDPKDKEGIARAKKIRKLWSNASILDTESILKSIN